MKRNFHELAVESILFKGRSDWYFCFLKSEKIAHVLALLAQKSDPHKGDFEDLVRSAGNLPHAIAHFAAGEMEPALVLADVFSLLSSVRLSATRGMLSQENALILGQEYEQIAEKIAAENRLSPFLSAQDLSVPDIPQPPSGAQLMAPVSDFSAPFIQNSVKDNSKGHIGQNVKRQSQAGSERMTLILDFVKKNNGVSIKDIASVVRNCSEKTIQRELTSLIRRGLVYREGERRWSLYKIVPRS
jgi:hypothetical protein